MKKQIISILIILTIFIGSIIFIIACQETPHIPIQPGDFALHPEVDKGMLIQINWPYTEDGNEIYETALILGKKYNAKDTYYENNKDGALVSNSLLPTSWQGDEWGCSFCLPDGYTATVTYYSSNYQGGKETGEEQSSINVFSWGPEDMQVSMDSLNKPISMMLAFPLVFCDSYTTDESIGYGTTDTIDEAILYKNEDVLNLVMSDRNLIIRYE